MSILLPSRRPLLAPPWARNDLWRRAQAMPTLDQDFAGSKSLRDSISGQQLITFTRASSGTFVDSAGVLQTAATDTPRFTHDPVTGESLGLLVEEARTNLLLNSTTLSTQNVTVAAVAHTLSFTGTGTITLSGTSTAGPLVGTGTGEANRASLTFTPTAGTLTLTVSGTVSNAQLEAGAFRTSWISTGGATATRSADVASITGTNFSSWYRQDEGTVYSEYRIPSLLTGTVASFDDATSNNRWQMRYASSPDSSRYRFVSSSGQFDILYTGSGAPLANSLNKTTIIATAGSQIFTTNGAAINSAGTQTVMPSVTQLQIGNGAGSDVARQITIRRLTYFPRRLPNETLVRLTQ